MALSALDMFSVGIGPSSSHTVGPMRAAGLFADRLVVDGLLDDVVRVQAELFGSLGATGHGHGSDKAVILGFQGNRPETVDTDTANAQVAEAAAVLAEALAGSPGSVIDLSANRTTFELAGPMARSVLEKGCSLDLHPRVFAVGAAYVTSVGAVPVLLWKTADEVFRVMPRASFADFLGRWLVDAMAEYQGPELP